MKKKSKGLAITNLVVGILFTAFLFLLLMAGVADGDSELVIGVFMFTPPVVLNWVSWARLIK